MVEGLGAPVLVILEKEVTWVPYILDLSGWRPGMMSILVEGESWGVAFPT